MTNGIIKDQSLELEYICSKAHALNFCCFLLIYEFSTYIANDMIMPGMIEVVKSFDATEKMISTSLSAFILGGASLQIILGPLSDQIGRRPVMIFGAIFFPMTTIFLASSQSMEAFIIGRFFQGMSLCFITVIGYAALQEIFTELYAVRLIATMNNITILAPLAGPLVGSLVLIAFTWRIIFLLIFIFGVISLIGLWLFMPETVGVRRSNDSIIEPVPLNFSVVINNYFALLKNRKFVYGSLGLAIINIPIIAWISTAPLILMKNAQLSVTGYALCQIPIFFAAIIGNNLMKRKTYTYTLTAIITTGSIILIISLLLMPILTMILKDYYLAMMIGMSAYSLGLGYITGPLNRKTLFSTSVAKGTASALLSLILMTTTAIGNQILSYLYLKNASYLSFGCAACGISYLVLSFLYYRFK